MSDLVGMWPIIGIPILRSVGGWIGNALKDNKIEMIEWKQLAETVVRVGLIGVATFYSFTGFGMDVSALSAAFAAFIIDKLFGAIDKIDKIPGTA